MSALSHPTSVLRCDPVLEKSVTWPVNVHTLVDLFRYQVDSRPDATLFTFQTDSETLRKLTYRQAWLDSLHLARSLDVVLSSGTTGTSSTGRRAVCGIWLEKSLELHLSMFGVIQSGGTWLGFDPDAPTSRVSACLEDSEAAILICDQAHHARAVEAATEARTRNVIVKTWDELMAMPDLGQTLSPPRASDPAYMIYTSGSTGTPKGIAIPHSAALTFALSERTVLETGPTDTVWQGFSPAFDMFIEEVWVSIAGGAHLAVGTRAECQNGPSLGGDNGVWDKRGVTVVNAVPTLIGIMTSLGDNGTVVPPSVRLLNVGGEACPPALVERIWRPSLSIINTYGPSETTVTATFDRLFPDKPVTIGTPLPFYHAILLAINEDDDSDLVPTTTLDVIPGAEGELCIGGPCLGLGYVNREQLTRSKFIQHPFEPDQKLYRTGDRVRVGHDAKLHFLGRIDAQIKHRGFRIELGEIENVLASCSIVKNTAVICTHQGTEQARLEAFVVCTQPTDLLNTSASLVIIRSALNGLPSYMHPEEYTFLDANDMPRLPSGKINAKALHRMAADRAEVEEEITTAVNKGSPTIEEDEDVEVTTVLHIVMAELARMFPQSSKTGTLKPSSDFFVDLGGHSLTAAILVSRLRTRGSGTPLGTIGLQQVYEYKTPEAMCQYLVENSAPELSLVCIDDDGQDDHVESSTTEIPTWRFVLCGAAQIPALLVFSLIYGLGLLAPYMVFVEIHRRLGTGWALLAAYGVFVVMPWALAIIGIVGVRVCLPRVRAGRYKLYGAFYYRWWTAKKFMDLIDQTTIGETPLYPVVLRLLGAKIGTHCHISALPSGPALGMLSIGDDTIVGKDVMFGYETVVPGYLELQTIVIEEEVNIGSRSVIEGGVVLESASETEMLTMVPYGTRIPKATVWAGSPARFERMARNPYQGKPTRPSTLRFLASSAALWLLGTFVVPILYFAPQIPSLLLFVVLSLRRDDIGHDHITSWKQTGLVSIPASLAYLLSVILELIILKFVIIGKVKPGRYKLTSWFMVRKWLVDRLMDMSLVVLHPIYASLYVVPFLRALGVKIGRRAEVSNAQGLNFDMLDIGDETFIADGVLLGQGKICANEMTLERTKVEPRAFAGNASVVPQGSVLPSDSLVGVLSIPPQAGSRQKLQAGKSCFGSPPVIMDSRQAPATTYADNLLFNPFPRQIAARLFIEFMRLWLPRLLVILAIGLSLKFWEDAVHHRRHEIGPGRAILLFPIFYICLFCMPALIITLALKWILVGEYKIDEWPLWSVKVWLSEMVTSIYESLLTPLFMQLFLGTPFCAMVLRLYGTTVGKRCTLLSNDITEFDMVTLGDECIMNLHSGPQTHLFEDRIMKIGHVVLGDHAVLKPYSICLPGSMVGQRSTVGSLSLVMKGETVPSGQEWEGAPIRRRMLRGKAPAQG